MINYLKEALNELKKPYPFTISLLVTFAIQIGLSNFWKRIKLGRIYNFGDIIIILIGLWLVNLLVNSQIIKYFRIKEVNPIDVGIVGSAFVIILTLVISPIYGNHNNLIWFILLLCCILLVIIRSFIISKKKMCKKIDNSFLELRDLDSNNIEWQCGDEPILLSERASNYDLLDRKNIQNLLINAINHHSIDHSYSIGLIGTWGSGKTTILNLVKQNDKLENTIFMHSPGDETQDFDVWQFGSKESMIKGLYDTFLTNLGIDITTFAGDRLIRNISQVVAGVPQVGGIFSSILSCGQSIQDINDMKKQLSKYILSTNNHFVLCIENLDRANGEQVILLLKLINTVFDLPNVTYVLLYSEERMNQILSDANSLDSSYIEKVINIEVKVPSDLNISKCKIWLQNLLTTYNISENQISTYDFLLDFISRRLNNIREFKRIVNSVFTILAISESIRLNLPQLLAIQYIFFSNKSLYIAIKHHKKIFTFEDTYGPYARPHDINNDDKNFFKKITESFSEYIPLLENLFPKFEKYITDNNISNFGDTEKNLKNRSINTRRYFDNYFYFNESKQVKINREVSNFISSINDGVNINSAWNDFFNKSIKNDRELYILELILFVDSYDIMSSQKRTLLSETIFDDIAKKEYQSKWDYIDKLRLVNIISMLIEETDDEDFQTFIQHIDHEYSAYSLIEKIVSDIEKRLEGRTSNSIRNAENIGKFFDKFRDYIYINDINLYDTKYYDPEVTRDFCAYLAKKDPEYLKCYIYKFANAQNIYKVLYDCLLYRIVGDDYQYKLCKESMDKIGFFKGSKLDKILYMTKSLTKSQSMIKDIYNAYSNNNDRYLHYNQLIEPEAL